MWTTLLGLVVAPIAPTAPLAPPVSPTFPAPRLSALQDQSAALLPSRPDEVTVYPYRASVLRRVTLPAGDGRYEIAGLPLKLVPGSVRAKVQGAEVVALEVRTSVGEAVPSERLEGLRQQIEALRLERRAVERQQHLAKTESALMRQLVNSAASPEVLAGEGGLEVWQRARQQALEGLARTLATEDELELQDDALKQRIFALEAELGQLSKGNLTSSFSVDLSVLDLDGDSDELELTYLVNEASWSPRYDLRTGADFEICEVIYRADVRQQTGEDWNGARVALATVEPSLGLVGPEPTAQWLNLQGKSRGAVEDSVVMAPQSQALSALGYMESDSAALGLESAGRKRRAESTWATVEAGGVQATFVLPRLETILSRSEPTQVLIGRAGLDMELERHCLPAIDTNVWRVGRAENTSPWVLLPGPATLFLDGDYLGTSELARVRTGEDFELPLGPDPNLTVARVKSEDLSKPPGVFGSKTSEFEAYRVTLEQTANEAVTVLVREVFPRAADSRIDVELDKSSQAYLTGERWDREFEETGVRSFALAVPARGSAELTWRSLVKYPSKQRLVRY